MIRKQLKICVVCNIKSIHCKRWVEALKSRGHEVTVLSEQRSDVDSIKIEPLKPPPYLIKMFPCMRKVVNGIYRKLYAAHVRKILVQKNPDIIYAHFLTDHGWLAIAADYHPTVVIAYGSDILVHPNCYTTDRIIVKKSMQRADGVIGVADHMRENLLSLGCSPERLRIIHNAVDLNLFCAEGKDLRDHKKRCSKPTIISTRAMNPIYNLQLLLRALPAIARKCPMVSVILVGEGTEKGRLESLARKLNVSERITFIPNVSYAEMPSLYKMADIFVSTSLSDGLCVSLLESMACGVFPIVSDIPGNRELIKNGINGYLFHTDVPKELAERVITAIRNPKMVMSAVNKNLKLVREKYYETLQIKKTEDFFYNIISKQKL